MLTVKVSDAKLGFHERTQQRIIADVDPGIDDIEALIFLINADQEGLLKLEAIVVTEGNTGYNSGIRNVFLLLKVLNRLDIPVYLGSKQALLQHDTPMGGYYGADGLGDLTWNSSIPVDLLKSERAFEAIQKLVKKYPNEVTYMSMGPLTTLGMTIWQYPEVADNLKQVYAMGGLEYLEAGEFNVAFDPESVDIVFRSLKSKMLLVTWQAGTINTPKTNWYKNITDVSNPAWNFMTRVQDQINTNLFGEDLSNATWEHCDPIVPGVFLNPKLIIENFISPLKIEVGRVPSRGVVTNSTLPTVPVNVILEIDYETFLVDYVNVFKNVCKSKHCKDVD